MSSEERLVIKCFHVTEVKNAEKTAYRDGILSINTDSLTKEAAGIELPGISVRLIAPEERHIYVNTIMDIFPISAKALGTLGNGITHTFTGLYAVLTGVDAAGIQIAEFGSSEGFLDEQIFWGRPGTPDAFDWILLIDLTLPQKAGTTRSGPDLAHQVSEQVTAPLRELLKKLPGQLCTERHDYYNTRRPGKPKVVLVKQVAGQGAMYDTRIFPNEPSGFAGARSIIDCGNMPVFLTPNEYRDGAIRALY